jgi:hypothetical protein
MIAAGATATAIAAIHCGDTMTQTDYGIAIMDYDADVDGSQTADATATDAARDSAVDSAPDGGPMMFDAAYGGPPLDSGADADDGD